jgi:hypothetical protein
MTLLTTQHSKLGGQMGEFLNRQFEPALYRQMKQKGYNLIPYVNSFGDTPDNGWPEFWDSPRYGSGYAALWNCFSFVPETHMLKPYHQRVKATYALMQCFINFTSQNSAAIQTVRAKAKLETSNAISFPISWTHDRTISQPFLYKGFTAERRPSDVSGLPRLYYNREKPYEKTIPLFNNYIAKDHIKKPKAYIIPQGWWKVIDLLQLNKVTMQQLKKDTLIEVEVYRITDYKAGVRPYEMHHLNTEIKTNVSLQKKIFRKGDWYILMNQAGNRFITEVLEPTGEDSYFTWNYFDGILGQKEGYSAYAFEDIAADYLKNNLELRTRLEQRRTTDTAFAKDGRAQLNFVYQNSPWFEPAFMQYPVYRIN